MKVYVASRFSEEGIAATRVMYSHLILAGHTISHDWTRESSDGKAGEELSDYLSKCARADLIAVRSSDALIFVNIDDVRLRGAYVEFGVALGLGRPVIVVGAKPGTLGMPGSCIFFMLPEVYKVSTPQEAIDILAQKEKILCP